VVSDGNLTDTAYYEEYIWAGNAPVADFEGIPTTVVVGGYANFTSLCTGEELTYNWTFEGATPDTSTAANPQEIYYLIMADSLYDVTLIATNVFGSDTMTKADYIHTIPDGINENSLNSSVVLFPNPSTGTVHLTLPANSKTEITVLNLLGNKMYSTQLNGSGLIKLNNLTKGVYFVRITDKTTGETIVKRLILN